MCKVKLTITITESLTHCKMEQNWIMKISEPRITIKNICRRNICVLAGIG